MSKFLPDDPRKFAEFLCERATGHAPGYDIAIYARPHQWLAIATLLEKFSLARPISEYHEDMGDVLWWKFPIEEPPYVGSPNDIGFTVQVNMTANIVTVADPVGNEKESFIKRDVGGWPGYHTHFTPIPIPQPPKENNSDPDNQEG
jgi:hypothetical protein